MFELKKGIDIVSYIGGLKNDKEAEKIFREKMDDINFAKIQKITNKEARLKIANAIVMGQPDSVFVNTGSPEDRKFIINLSVKTGEESPLAINGHTIHYDLAEEQARIIDRTFYITNDDEKVSTLALRISRIDALKYVQGYMTGMMKGMTLIVGFYSRGPIGAFPTIPAIEATTSCYVCHSAELLYRNCFNAFDSEVERVGHFFTNIHSQGPNRSEDLPNARVFMDRAHQTTYSTFCTYAGNTLLLKKGNHRLAVDRATYYRRGKEISEHMFITGIQGLGGRMTFFAGAAPSGCGKTTTAMTGHEFISDDLAQIWIAEDGTLRSVNPECGIFGIIKDVNWVDDPMMLKLFRNENAEIIFSNVLIDENKKPHWEGYGEEAPKKGFNFQGEWQEGKKDQKGKPVPISHPNARFTLKCEVLDNYSKKIDDPVGVITKVFTYSGRDSDTMPPVWVAKNADHGVAIGASLVSQATATEVGATGVKRSPWANQAFIPGRLGDYMHGQFEFFNSDKIKPEHRPILAGLNYFLTEGARGGQGEKLLGEKRDVHVWMGWLERLVHNEVGAIETPIGFLPRYEDLKALFKTLINKDYDRALYDRQFSLYIDNIVRRLDLQTEAYRKDENIPERLFEIYEEQKKGLLALKAKYGPIVTPDQLEKGI
ncbi:Phosphoenolpyruvate carboxykinase (GTP) [uncultured Desulfobacterium sp.]|uniref:phosphoenolpyruvate carboxykinase (GTP) n=1 Tax=uncultured Desulfobacterium sp. TaxID=201089 RepID=A0A445MVI0_9BACT|nr:Phosphoenolpyruvate carboxykinase (GTP) [uncultured Desulfobacterium sp.]